jgi:hypothetical protein
MAPEPDTSKAAVEGTKKKRNRKKKTKTGAAKEEKVLPVVKEPQNALNPTMLLRNKLVEKGGFNQGQIDKAMEEMWDRQLPYDEYESVLKYLKSGASAFAQVQAQVQAAPSQTPKAAAVKEAAAPELESEVEEEEDSPVEEPEEVEESTTSDQQPQMSMASKLDMVAGFENFTDGAFALTEWVSKVAKPHEVRIASYYEIEQFLIGWCIHCIALLARGRCVSTPLLVSLFDFSQSTHIC